MRVEPLGKRRLSAQIIPDHRGLVQGETPRYFIVYIHSHTCVRFKRSGRIGWRWNGLIADKLPYFPSRLEALRAARALIKTLNGNE